VITKIGTTDIEDMSDLHQALREAKEDTTVSVELIRKGVHKTVKLAISTQDDRMMFNFGGRFPGHQDFRFDNFNLDGFNFDHEQWRDMLKDLRPQLDQLRKQIRIRVHGAEVNDPIEIEEETEGGTEL
ncbi:MAG TPA: PDZ domain-containing protein, partial [Bacteroidota bacterium]|nr:PDZ domain-containing protein [Bacteroidota bacterium]